MDELPGRDLHRVRHLFEADHLALVIDAMVAGNSPATAWVDDGAMPRAVAIWDGAHSLYITGAADRAGGFGAAVGRHIAAAKPGLVKVSATEAAFGVAFAGHPLDRRERVFYRGDRPLIPDWRHRLPAGMRISSIGGELRQLGALGNFADVTGEIESCWPSMDDFLRAGFGFCAHDGEVVVCWCTAEYVSNGRCGIGIETIPAYRGRGVATLTASAFVEHCAARGVTPHWDSWLSNAPSVAVAEKIGFRKVETYSIFVAHLS